MVDHLLDKKLIKACHRIVTEPKINAWNQVKVQHPERTDNPSYRFLVLDRI